LKTLTWYTIKEHIGPFFFALFTITFIFILNAVFRDLGKLLTKGLPFTTILRFFAYNLAWILALSVPMAVLVSSLMAFGRMSADHEITAIKAGGINFYRLIAPILIISLFMAAGMERFNNVVLPEINHQYRQLYRAISRKKPAMMLEEGVFNKIEGYSMLVQKIDSKTNRLTDIIINDLRDRSSSVTIIAKSGQVKISTVSEKLILDLYDGEIHEVKQGQLEKYRRSDFEKYRISISLPNMNLEENNISHRGNREKSAAMLRKSVIDDLKQIHRYHTTINSMGENELKAVFPASFFQVETDSIDNYMNQFYGGRGLQRIKNLQSQIESQITNIKNVYKAIGGLKVEIHKKYSLPLICVVFVLIGAPLGIMSRQAGLAVGGGFSIIFFIIYWMFLIGGEQLADRGLLSPAVSMWLPNVLMGGLGIVLMRKAIIERTVFNWSRLKIFKRRSS